MRSFVWTILALGIALIAIGVVLWFPPYYMLLEGVCCLAGGIGLAIAAAVTLTVQAVMSNKGEESKDG